MKIKHLWMVPAVSLAASTSAFSQEAAAEAIADIPAAAKVNKEAEDFEASKADVLLKELSNMMIKTAKKEGHDIDADEILNILGLKEVGSYAYSSDKQGEEYINLLYLHDNGANKGIFKILGVESAKYTVPTMSPKGTDLAFQVKLNLGDAEEMIKALMKAVNAPDEDIAEFEAVMEEDVPQMNMNTSAMLKRINVNVNLALDMDPTEKLNTPLGAFDKPRLVARIDEIKWAWGALDKLLQDPNAGLVRTEKDGVIIFKAAAQMQAMMMGYAPLIVMDTNKDQLWFATSQEFLGRCKSGENTLADDENYQATIKGLPNKGSSLFYISKDLAKFITEIIDEQIKQGNMEKNEDIQEILRQLRGVKTGAIQTYTRDETGAHFSSRSTESVKDSLNEMKKVINEAMEVLK